jgi:hypothetical protein
MGFEIMAFVLFGLAILHGWLWSVQERRKAVQAAYDEIRKQVRREREQKKTPVNSFATDDTGTRRPGNRQNH